MKIILYLYLLYENLIDSLVILKWISWSAKILPLVDIGLLKYRWRGYVTSCGHFCIEWRLSLTLSVPYFKYQKNNKHYFFSHRVVNGFIPLVLYVQNKIGMVACLNVLLQFSCSFKLPSLITLTIIIEFDGYTYFYGTEGVEIVSFLLKTY